jgi:hypothetical protein
MRRASIYADGHSANSLFALEDSVHRYNPTYTPRLLRQAFLERGIELNTTDINLGQPIAFELHLEGRPLSARTVPRYLLALENPNINPLNASAEYCAQFDRVFSWDPRLFQLQQLEPILIPHPMVYGEMPGPTQRDIFSCLINANKAFKSVQATDLYLERLQTIRWYEKHAPGHFSLYGLGWDKSTPAFTLPGRLRRAGERLKSRLFGMAPFPSYRGPVPDKAAVLQRARFSYCYENSRDLSNYITEKIFDSLVNGCVPVYWGADNVLEYLPADCFIDRRNFRDTAEVHAYLLSVDDVQYAAYQQAIVRFLDSATARRFSSEYIAQNIATSVMRNLDFLQDM